MNKFFENKILTTSLLVIVFLAVNLLFTFKYSSRTSLNPYFISALYAGIVLTVFSIISKIHNKFSEKTYKWLIILLVTVMTVMISVVLIKVDRYTINVDRWSALTYFWDGVFRGEYPYGIHTHVWEGNFPSPFPFWHLLALPFYLMGDVGIQIIFFLVALAFVLRYYFQSYNYSFLFILILAISPGYWWEVLARSDSLSNAFFVFFIILWYMKSGRKLNNNLIISMLIVSTIIATRFTAWIPIALFFFPSFLTLTGKQKIFFLSGVLVIAFLFFAPFIFWDTETWVFFRRNPFMSQTGNGNIFVLVIFAMLGTLVSLKWKTNQQFFIITALFFFTFILATQIATMIPRGGITLKENSVFDLSYFNLALPYCIIALSMAIDKNYLHKKDEKIEN